MKRRKLNPKTLYRSLENRKEHMIQDEYLDFIPFIFS